MVTGQLAGLTNQPLLCKITIQNSAGGVYTYDPTAGANPPSTGTYDFRLKSLNFTPPSDFGVAGTFDMVIHSPTDSAFLQNVQQYSEVTIWVGKTATLLTKLFLGSIEHIIIEEPTQNEMYIHITGPDWGSCVLKNRLINRGWYQLKLAGSNDPDPTDTSTDIVNLVNDILTNAYVYPVQPAAVVGGNSVTTVQDQGVIVSSANILGGITKTLSIPYFEANYEYVDDKLSELDSYLNACHYIDANKNFIMKFLPVDQSQAPDSGVLLTDDFTDAVAVSWSSGLKGLIAPNTSYDLSAEMHKTMVLGLGGNNILLDQSQQDRSGGSDNVDSQYLAVQFTPQYNQIQNISLYIKKTPGSIVNNPLDCQVDLVYDLNGKPNGSTITSVTISKDAITTSGGWHTALIASAVVVGSPFWIIVRKQGDSTHTYSWYKGGSGQTVATSSDGVNWTVTTNTAGYCFEVFASTPLLKVAQNGYDTNVNFGKNDLQESVVRKPFVIDQRSMTFLLQFETYNLFRYKEIFKCKVYAPDTLLSIGQRVRIRKQLSKYKFDANYIISGIEYTFEGDEQGGIGSFYYDLTAVLYSQKSAGQTTGAS